MTKGYSADQLRAAEAPHLAAGEPLMQRAASALADEVRAIRLDTPGAVVLLVGAGDNGGDALFAGARLAADGIPVRIVRTSGRVHEAGLAAALGAGAVVVAGPSGAAVIVDGILGIGAGSGTPLRGRARDVVEAILARPGRPVVVAVDIPSGLNPDDGTVADGVVLPADLTVTFGGYKAGLLLPPGRELAGTVRLIDIGITADLDALVPLVVS